MAPYPPKRSATGQACGRSELIPSSSLDLTDTERELVDLMHRVGFGRLEQAEVSQGLLHFGDRFRVVRDVRLGASGATEDPSPDPFSLKKEVQELICLIRGLECAVIRKVEIRHGLPAHIQIEEPAVPREQQ